MNNIQKPSALSIWQLLLLLMFIQQGFTVHVLCAKQYLGTGRTELIQHRACPGEVYSPVWETAIKHNTGRRCYCQYTYKV